MRDKVMNLAAGAVDILWDMKRYQVPTNVSAPKIIAHRGAWDKKITENTMAAFAEALHLGAWGIEFDVHFSKDGVPVVHHDEDLLRCFKQNGVLRELGFDELRKLAPKVPTLEEVLSLKGLHFMIEIKTALSPDQKQTLSDILKKYRAVEDYHLLTLDYELMRTSSTMPEAAWILVGELALKSMVEISLARSLGGVAGHFLGMNESLIMDLHAQGQMAGVGFVPSKNLYRREWARGIDWVFTNSMPALQNAE